MKVLSITRLLTLSLLAFMSAFVMAETSDRRFEKYNASDGLADNSAQTIYCTKEGRMVITTMGQINFFGEHISSQLLVERVTDRFNVNTHLMSAHSTSYSLTAVTQVEMDVW